ncbi:MAG TPA: dephospho-CoA kinase [Humidesulfovibrio sp.]|uniref:dephospho-CoA kinase n=1 Tax=Humidesulfovibrio sp. TaxID=2910988 RepID=UPI002CC7CC99|nr:dephospho-CoA kinase [Humidesulfovibrio sp.]HWR03562.1 dephospho-CoA kinase [Humidesulfovibrio sp.]
MRHDTDTHDTDATDDTDATGYADMDSLDLLDADDFAEILAESAATGFSGGTLERKATPDDTGTRLDQFWAYELVAEGVSRERVKEWIQAGLAQVDGKPAKKPGQRLEGYERLTLDAPDLSGAGVPKAEAGELRILHRDAALAVIDKPAGLTTHPAATQPDGTLVNRLLHHFPELAPEVSGMEGERPGIVHRLDKDTSGLILVALTEAARLELSRAFAERRVHKTYLALVHGRPKGDDTGRLGEDAGYIDLPLGRHPSLRTKMAVLQKGGRDARTSWRRLWTDRLGRASLLAVDLHTGRTHQIRVHLAHVGNPLVGDPVYGPSAHARWLAQKGPLATLAPRQMLHAFRLAFEHPDTGEEMFFRQDPPQDFMTLLRALAGDCQRVVITGMPGCGKSALLRALADAPEAPPTFSADACVAALYAPGGDGAALLARSLGRGILDAEGAVDRKGLLALLLKNPSLRREVEDIVHPLVRHALSAFWAEHSAAPLAVAEIPLFFEAGWLGEKHGIKTSPKAAQDRRMADVVVGVRCPEDLRQGPLRESRGLAPEVLAAFESWQWPEDRKLTACDLIVDNAAGLAELKAEAGRLLAQLADLRAERARATEARLRALLDAAANAPALDDPGA